VRHPERARANLADPTMLVFYGCPPMALLTVGAGALLVWGAAFANTLRAAWTGAAFLPTPAASPPR